MTTAALCLIYNHRYEGNVQRLNAMYNERFSAVRHLIPFTTRTDPSVLPVAASSWNFQAHIAQNARALAALDVEWLVFAGDDLLLHPSLDERTLAVQFGLQGKQGFIKNLRAVADVSVGWYFWDFGVMPWTRQTGVEWKGLLPSPEQAGEAFAMHSLSTSSSITLGNLVPGQGMPGAGISRRSWLRGVKALAMNRGRLDFGYPLAMGYSDVFVVHRSVFPVFANYLGVMAAMGVFAEVAVPTALCLATNALATEATVLGSGRELWTLEEQRALVAEHGANLDNLLRSWPQQLLWLHPVKFSEWSNSTHA